MHYDDKNAARGGRGNVNVTERREGQQQQQQQQEQQQ